MQQFNIVCDFEEFVCSEEFCRDASQTIDGLAGCQNLSQSTLRELISTNIHGLEILLFLDALAKFLNVFIRLQKAVSIEQFIREL